MKTATSYNIFSQLREEIEDFDKGGHYIVGKPRSDIHFKEKTPGEDGGYYFSQKELLESIDLAVASKYQKGIKDRENQRKTYLNIVTFFRDVMKMKININVSNYILEPLSLDFTWPVWFMDRKFKIWSGEESYDDQIDEYAHDLATYGTCVGKPLKDCTKRVPLRSLRNTPSAKTLKEAAANGGYVIIEDEMHYNLLTEYPAWKIDGLSKKRSYKTFERYALVPRSLYDAWQDGTTQVNTTDDDEMVLVLAVLLPADGFMLKKKENEGGKILFMEMIDEVNLEECHLEKVDGRWIGRGEVEKQLENQISRNLNANLRRRGLLWATKKIFQSTDDEVQKNLVMEVKDGDVLKIKPNGTISQVNTANQHLNEFAADDNAWKENSQQIAFAFEVATGESMPSGTPFSLGVLLDKSVASHFKLARNTFSNYLQRAFFDQLIPIFQNEYDEEHEMQIPLSGSDIENLKEAMIVWHTNDRMFKQVLKGKPVVPAAIRMEVEDEMAKNMYLFLKIPPKFYKNARYYMKLNIDDDIGADLETLKTIWSDLNAKGDPRADQILRLILAKQGKAYDNIVPPTPKQIVSPEPVKPMQPVA